ncbi:MAG TPA: heme o synthase [Candidatus Paceibacterota bacterium]
MKYYYELTKSGLVFGNLVTVIAGFLLGARIVHGILGILPINWGLLLATVVGIALVMASGCVFNNYIDRDIDIKMDRTKQRALVKSHVSGRDAFVFASVLGIVGFLVLILCTNLLATLAAVVGFIFYVCVYTLWGKRNSVYGTFIGAIAGATPPVVGYAAASGRIDMAAAILFLIMLAWQMPHFFAIAIRRHDDYAAAGVPVMPVKNGLRRTKFSMLIYIIEFALAASLLFMFGYAGIVYLVIALVLGLVWLADGLRGFWITDSASNANRSWARQMFFLSLIVMVVLFITIALGAIV